MADKRHIISVTLDAYVLCLPIKFYFLMQHYLILLGFDKDYYNNKK